MDESERRTDWASRADTLKRQAPRLCDLAPLARRRMPAFCHDFLQGGAGDETGLSRNRAALEGIEIVPRYGVALEATDTSTTLFGQRLTAPLVAAPVGMDGALWPGATRAIAAAAHDSGVAYMTGTLATASVENVAKVLPERLWFQIYAFPADDHRVTFDLARRADAAGVRVLALTLDIPLPARRPRDLKNGISLPPKMGPRIAIQAALRPAWLRALARHGMPAFHNLAPYARPNATRRDIEAFVRSGRAGAALTWDVVARMRDAWPHALVVKGVMHPADAEQAAALGLDGVIVSNHGGRQFDPSPAPIDMLPAIRAAVGGRLKLLVDSGIMSGADMLRAVAIGADAVLVGRGMMMGLAAFGEIGARHVCATLIDEFRIALGQTGALTVEGARHLALRHPTAWAAEALRPAPTDTRDP